MTRRRASLSTSSKIAPFLIALLLSVSPRSTTHSAMNSHHAMTLALGDKLYLAPLNKDKVHVCPEYSHTFVYHAHSN